MVLAQYVHGNAFILGPDLRKQDLEALPTKASAAPMPLDEELAQVGLKPWGQVRYRKP